MWEDINGTRIELNETFNVNVADEVELNSGMSRSSPEQANRPPLLLSKTRVFPGSSNIRRSNDRSEDFEEILFKYIRYRPDHTSRL